MLKSKAEETEYERNREGVSGVSEDKRRVEEEWTEEEVEVLVEEESAREASSRESRVGAGWYSWVGIIRGRCGRYVRLGMGSGGHIVGREREWEEGRRGGGGRGGRCRSRGVRDREGWS